MIHFERSLLIDATPDAVWQVLGRFMEIDRFAPQITQVEPVSALTSGVGAQRRNTFENGSSLVETATVWNEGRGYTVALSEMDAIPLIRASSEVRIEAVGGKSKVFWTFDYQVKFGPLGWLLGQTLMKMMMGKIIDANSNGLSKQVRSA